MEYEMRANEYVTFSGIAFAIGFALMLFLGASFIAMVLIYITDLHVLLRRYINQNERLLDGMHEGLLILTKGTN